ncbi:MAG: SBBP repeat-containing protein [Methylacidiphilales bacterium]|nr:SBBP repeat-containing protein [Candidatus Methylacidiphilales bacterium]
MAKFTSQGARLWGTYFGGESTDIAHSIAADSKGNIIIVGETTTQNNLMPSGYQNTFGGGIYDGFILSINPEGNSINWRTYIGGPGNDWLHTVTIDSADSVIVAGRTSSKSAITKSASQNTYGGGAFDAIIAKFDSKGNLTWSTYYGGKGNDIAFGITTDTSDNLYIAGQTTSRDNIAQNGVRNRKSGKIDAFLVKLSPSGSRLWGTYYGRLQDDQGFAVATDPLGNIYLVGQTQSTGTETTSPHQATYAAGEADGFIACYNTNCN